MTNEIDRRLEGVKPGKPVEIDETSKSEPSLIPAPDEAGQPEIVDSFGRSPDHLYGYSIDSGDLAFVVARWDARGSEKKAPIPYSVVDTPNGPKWREGLNYAGLPAYNLPDVLESPTKTILVVEGEKTADAAIKMLPDYAVTTSQGGTNAAHKTDWSFLAGRRVVIWPDNDSHGMRYARDIVKFAYLHRAEHVSIVHVPDTLPHKWDLADPIPRGLRIDIEAIMDDAAFMPLDAANMRQIVEDFQDEGSEAAARNTALTWMNQNYFVVKSLGGKARVCSYRTPTEIDIQAEADLITAYKNIQVYADDDKDGNPIYKPLGSMWMSSPFRRTYRSMGLFPDGDAPYETYNTWRGFGVDPRPGSWDTIAEFIHSVICGGDDDSYAYLMGWLARCVQYPGKPAEVAVVLRGLKGTGKGTFAQLLTRIFHRHSRHISNSKHLTGAFNYHLADCLFLFADEAFWAGDKAGEGTLKALITEPTLFIEPKGVNGYQVPNRLKILMASNEDWVVPATGDERRFFVLEVASDRRGDRNYFSKVKRAIEGDECKSLMDYLLNEIDISAWDHRQVPDTGALDQQRLMSASHAEKFWIACLDQGRLIGSLDPGWPTHIKPSEAHAYYLQYGKGMGDRYPMDLRQFSILLRKMLGGKVYMHRSAADETGARPKVYALQSLPAVRDAFCRYLNVTLKALDWDEGEC